MAKSKFPTLTPTGRQYDSGDWPVRKYTAQDGSEVRLLYGNRRVNHTLTLDYQNIPDKEAEKFIDDYINQKGTYETFAFESAGRTAIARGWNGTTGADFFKAGAGAQWRYAQPPQITAAYPGFSSVSIKLIAVGVGT